MGFLTRIRQCIAGTPGRWIGAPLASMFLAVAVATASASTVPQPITESFTGATLSQNYTWFGSPCLTAGGGSGNSPAIPTCSSSYNHGDTSGSGVLQLTNNTTSQFSAVIENTAFSTTYGIQVIFDYFAYGGTVGADGLAVFLADATQTQAYAGSAGGGLGYTAGTLAVNANTFTPPCSSTYVAGSYTPGIAGGALAIGLDSFGNFSKNGGDHGEICDLGGPGFTPNAVVLRDAISASSRYLAGGALSGIKLTSTTASSSSATRPSGTPPVVGGTPGWSTVRVTVVSTTAKVEIDAHDGNGFQSVSTTNLTSALPASVVVGFAASTGGLTDYHEVRNLNIVPVLPSLTISKVANTTNFTAGQNNAYTLTVGNQGNQATSGTITVTDTLPSGETYGSGSGTGWNCGASGQTVTCTSSTAIAAQSGASPTLGNPITLTVAVAGSVTGSLSNTASASGGGALNTPSSTISTPTIVPTLSLTKSHTGNFTAGQNGVYTLTVGNTGTAPTSGTITVTDTLPTGETYVSGTGTGWNCNASGQTVTCTSTTAIATSASGNPITLTVSVAGSATGTLTNTASASGGGATNTPTQNDPTGIIAPTLTLSKSHSGSFTAGQNGVYTLTVGNSGTAATSGTITVTDTLPTGETYVSGTGTGWNCNASGQTVTCTSTTAIATSASGNPITLTVAVGASVTGSITNTASASGGGATNTPTASDPTNTVAPQLSISKVHVGTFTAGQNGSYTITVGNTGAVSTSGTITVTDTLPTGETYVSGTGTGWSCGASGQAVTCTSSTAIANGASGNPITLTVAISHTASATLTNTANASGGGATNTPSSTDTYTGPVLTVSKSHSGNFTAGQNATYTITVGNTGGAATSGTVTVSDTLPTGETYVSGGNGTWSCGASGQLVTCTSTTVIVATSGTSSFPLAVALAPTAPASLTNVANAYGGGAFNAPTSGTAVSASDTATIIQAATNVVFDGNQLGAGGTILAPISGATVQLVNPLSGAPISPAGNAAFPNLSNTDPYTTSASGVFGFGLSPAQVGLGAPGGSITYNLQVSAPGYTSRLVQVVVTPVGAGPNYNVTLTALDGQPLASACATPGPASVVRAPAGTRGVQSTSVTLTTSPITCSNVSNVLADIPMFGPNLVVTKVADRGAASSGDRVVYTITATNKAATSITNPVVTDVLPPGIAYAPGTSRVDGTALEPNVSGSTLTWSGLSSLASNASHVITIATTVAPGTPTGVQTNLASATGTFPGAVSVLRSNATAQVTIQPGVFADYYTIVGRVLTTTPHKGVAGVRIFMEDGTSVVTDREGRYSLSNVRPGAHMLRLDTTTLPAGIRVYQDRRYDSVRSPERLVHGLSDTQIIQDVNFEVEASK